jgi:ATP-dependent exoDNAse (exonuclease V) beta subunit
MAALPAKEVLSVLGKASDGGCPACDEDMLFQGAIDLLAVGDGFAEIVDYKYSQKGEESLRKTYAVQLRLYRMAVAKILKLPLEQVRCTIVNIYRGLELEIV